MLKGLEAVAAYQALHPKDQLDDLSEQDKLEFELEPTEVEIRRVPLRLDKLMVYAGMTPSNSAARRLLSAGAVDVDEVRTTEPNVVVLVREDTPSFVLRVGRQQKRIKFVD